MKQRRVARPSPSRSAAVLLLSTGLLLTACSSGEPAVSADTKPLSDPSKVSPAELVYPLDPYKTTNEQIRSLETAQDLLVADCMKRFGFTYKLPVRPAPRPNGTSLRYGITDEARAARYGYARPGGPAPDPEKLPEDSLPPAERLALTGPPLKSKPGGGLVLPPLTLEESRKTDSGRTLNGQKVPIGGCSREGHLSLYAEKKEPVELLYVFGMESEASTRAQQSPKVAKAVKAWSACMAEKGYSVTDPVSPHQALGLEADGDDGSAKAIAAAKQDVACKKRTDLVALWYTAEVGFQKELMEEHAETLSQVKVELDERIKKAASVNR
ncbi:hypothetical protein OG357_16135 [Streptomyces sp. NBC_01255]|uniref:hypothetical protein n=1 Tax=Streptomyces sp. NBC_01255 TaxID=2903798 RepID=UPI002E317862|nr:hypothetical protein [Streptomyces sp. NBC_01255]